MDIRQPTHASLSGELSYVSIPNEFECKHWRASLMMSEYIREQLGLSINHSKAMYVILMSLLDRSSPIRVYNNLDVDKKSCKWIFHSQFWTKYPFITLKAMSEIKCLRCEGVFKSKRVFVSYIFEIRFTFSPVSKKPIKGAPTILELVPFVNVHPKINTAYNDLESKLTPKHEIMTALGFIYETVLPGTLTTPKEWTCLSDPSAPPSEDRIESKEQKTKTVIRTIFHKK